MMTKSREDNVLQLTGIGLGLLAVIAIILLLLPPHPQSHHPDFAGNPNANAPALFLIRCPRRGLGGDRCYRGSQQQS